MESTPFFRGIAAALLVVLALLLSVSAFGQTTGPAAMFEGRPAMAGAQGGIGAQAGPPQGGIGVQGSSAAGIELRRPEAVDVPQRPGLPTQPPTGAAVDRPSSPGVTPPRDPGVAREQSTTRKVQRAARRTVDRTRDRTPLGDLLPGS